MQAYRLVRRPAAAAPARLTDPAQQQVIAHTAGPALVLGGPGTGKTSTLVEAVAARVTEGIDPEHILVLTFGRRAASTLRHRIEARIAGAGHRVVHEPLVRTFPAYAFGLLRRIAAERGEPSPRLLTGPEQDLIIRELLEVVGEEPEAEEPDPVGWPEELRPALRTRAFAAQLRDLLQRAAERGVGPVELARLGEQLGRADWPAAARFLREYVAVLALRDVTNRGSIAYDNAELVRAAAGMLRDDPDLLAAERRRLAYVYVDELAETDPAQLDLLELIAGGGKNLVAFGDPDSSTYAFRGADPSGVSAFPARFRTASGAPARTTVLRTCHRHGPELLAATGRVARRLRGPRTRSELVAAPQAEPGRVEVATFRSATSEAAYLAHTLRAAHLLDGVPWSRMAVVMRSSARTPADPAARPARRRGADRRARRGPAAAPAAGGRAAAAVAALRAGAAPARRGDRRRAAALAARRRRSARRAAAAAGTAGAGARRAVTARPSGELLVTALRDPDALAAIDRRWAEPAQTVARLLAVARRDRGPSRRHRRGRALGRLVGQRARRALVGGDLAGRDSLR